MKIISSIVSVVFAVALIMMVAVPVIGDSLNGDETFYNDGSQKYAFYESGSIPNRHYTYDGTDFKIDGVKYELGKLTPACFTSALSISNITRVSVTHNNILTGDQGATAFNGQIVDLKSLDITISGGKVSGSMVKTTGSGESATDHTYTLTQTTLNWAFLPATNGEFTAVSIDSGAIYVESLNDLSYVSAPGAAYAILYDGTATHSGTTTTAEALFPNVETLYDDDGGSVLKVTMPPTEGSFFKGSSTFWIMAPASVFHDDVEVTTEDQLVSFIPLLLILGVVIGVIGMVVRRS